MFQHEIDPASWQSFRRILAVRLDNIGDVIMLGPALRSLRVSLPHAHISLLASPAGSQAAPLLPWIDQVITWRAVWQELSSSSGFSSDREAELIDILHQGRYDAAFIFTSFSQSPFPPAYACFLAGIPTRVGHSKEFGGQLLTHAGTPPPDLGHQVDRNLALLDLISLPLAGKNLELHIPREAALSANELLVRAGLGQDEPFIILAPGASCSARRYDPQRFARVAQELPNLTGMRVIVIGSQREVPSIEPVLCAAEQSRSGAIISLVGLTSVLEVAALIRNAKLVIANNSASLHLADAFNRPMVITYSGTEYLTQWEPRKAPAHLLRVETECSPCYSFQCPFSMECLDIQPEEVVRACLTLSGVETESRSYPAGIEVK